MANSVSRSALWCLLQQRANNMPSLKELFRADPQRFTHFSASACGILLDYSKQRIDTTAKLNLLALARQQEVEPHRDAMLRGEAINNTENRAVLHTVLRLPKGEAFELNGENIAADVHKVLAQMRSFSDAVREGRWLGYSGKAIRTIVNIGIGGSDWGPQMACIALAPWSQKNLSLYFVSNVDGRHVADALANADPETTLFVVASKTFATMETLTNAQTARDWMLAHGCPAEQIRQHFVALSTNVSAAAEFGIAPENVFPFWNWAGGRYSMWSAIGLSIALYVGMDRFEEMLAGAHEMDLHFAQAPLEQNLPVLMALIGVWNINFLGLQALSIAPYHQRMTRVPAYLQQLEMESNGKSPSRAMVSGSTTPLRRFCLARPVPMVSMPTSSYYTRVPPSFLPILLWWPMTTPVCRDTIRLCWRIVSRNQKPWPGVKISTKCVPSWATCRKKSWRRACLKAIARLPRSCLMH